jgi:hypothetical protein
MSVNKAHAHYEAIPSGAPIFTPLSEDEYKWEMTISGGTESQRYWMITQDNRIVLFELAYATMGYSACKSANLP